MSDQSITSYCVEYAATQQSKCEDCQKMIPHKSLRVAEIYRKNKKVKKNQAKHTWYHFKCFKVPKMLTFLPLELFKGYPSLEEKDKVRVQKVIKNGIGSCWKDMALKEKQEKEEQQEEGAEESNKSKKRKAQADDDEDIDMTAELTGTQDKKKPKKNQPKNKKEAENKKDIDTKKKNTSPANKNKKEDTKKGPKKLVKKEDKKQPTKVKEVKLAKDDQLELESIANEFKMLQEQ
ncbi:hypothetical protein K501DRAFT_240657 [Backusella circina FSU 941]|nr:hypothetical protein K501DRAFT_240657 [Backusella circina FSU 941]